MRKDEHLIFENYWAQKYNTKPKGSKRPTSSHGMPVDPSITGSKFGMETPPKGDAIQNTINRKLAQKTGSRAEDAEESGDDIMAKIEAKRKTRKNIGDVRSKIHGEDAETYGVEDKIKAALHEVESFGYTGDHIDPVQIAKLVVGSQGDWGDEYGSLVQALSRVIEAYYSKGLQDS